MIFGGAGVPSAPLGTALGPVLGDGSYRYAPVAWPAEQPSDPFADAAGVLVDDEDAVIAFRRSAVPLTRFSRDGRVLAEWGEGIFRNPHGIHAGRGGALWCTDDGDHTVRKLTPGGEIALVIGMPGSPSAFMSGTPFRRCTQVAEAPNGDIYVSDGYGNASIHRFDAEGILKATFGGPGVEPGQFNLPHSIHIHDDVLYVADRENHRVQLFDLDGHVVDEWHGLHRPSGLARTPDGDWVVAELGPMWSFNRGAPNLGPRLSILSCSGEVRARLTLEPAAGTKPGQLVAPHSVAVDSRGDIYIGQVWAIGWPMMFPDEKSPVERATLVKWARV